jgi:hypothetical protein
MANEFVPPTRDERFDEILNAGTSSIKDGMIFCEFGSRVINNFISKGNVT